MTKEPKLIFTNDPLRVIVQKLIDGQTLVVTDNYNYPLVHDLGPSIVVEDQKIEHIEKVKSGYQYEKILAVGGCTALDFGRACAVQKEIIAVPTILSNSCLSTNRSVINRGGTYRSELTIAPLKTIISIPTITANHADEVKKWSASGLGDLFSSVSAAIEREWKRNLRSFRGLSTLHAIAPVNRCIDALNWALTSPSLVKRSELKKLAVYLHESSVDVIRNGNTELNAGSEHWLYYRMQEQQKFNKMIATHGRVVSIGNLITTRIFGEAVGDLGLYGKLRKAHEIVGLPRTYTDLAVIGILKEHIERGLASLEMPDCLFADYFAGGNYDVLDRIFGDGLTN